MLSVQFFAVMLDNKDLLFSPEPIRAVAVYPLNERTKGGDKSLNGNPPGSLPRTRPGPGPAGRPKGATVFPGRTIGSFPIKRKLTRELFKADGITYIAWIRPQRASGVIFSFGVTFGLSRRRLYASFRPLVRIRLVRTPAVISRITVPRNRWSYVAVSYNQKTRRAKLYLNSRRIASKKMRYRMTLSGNKKAHMGKGYRGSIACMQIYRSALSPKQIVHRSKRCFRGRKYAK